VDREGVCSQNLFGTAQKLLVRIVAGAQNAGRDMFLKIDCCLFTLQLLRFRGKPPVNRLEQLLRSRESWQLVNHTRIGTPQFGQRCGTHGPQFFKMCWVEG